MSAKINISDSATSIRAEVDNYDGQERSGLVVATRPLKKYWTLSTYFYNSTYGVDMNKDATYGGSPVALHNGTDNAYWTASAITGTWVVNSLAQAHTGTHSIDATATTDGDILEIAKGSDQDLTGYTAITGWIYISGAWPTGGTKAIHIYGMRSGALVGTEVILNSHISTLIVGSWQKFTIPLSDMALTGQTVDSFRVRTIDIGAGSPPDYFLDDIQIEETGAPIVYQVGLYQKKTTWVKAIKLFIADAYAGTLASASMPAIPYNSLLGVSALTLGTLVKIYAYDTVLSFNFKQLSDFISLPNASMVDSGSDGTNTWFTAIDTFSEPIELRANTEDKVTVSIQDDLTGLLRFRATAQLLVEV